MHYFDINYKKLETFNTNLFIYLFTSILIALQIWKPAALLLRNLILLPASLLIITNLSIIKKLISDKLFILLTLFLLSSIYSLFPFQHGTITIKIILNWLGFYILAFFYYGLVLNKERFFIAILGIPVVIFILSEVFISLNLMDHNFIFNEHDRLIMGLQAPTRTGIIYSFNLVLCFFFIKNANSQKTKFFYYIILISYIYIVLITGTRAALIGSLMGIILFLPKAYNTINLSKILVYLALVFIIILITLNYFAPLKLKNRLLTTVNFNEKSEIFTDSLPSRIGIWKISIIAFDDYLKGIGFGRFQEYYTEQSQRHNDIIENAPETAHVLKTTSNAHNLVLHILIENGIFGLIIMLIIFYTIIQRGYLEHKLTPYSAAFLSSFFILQLNYNLNTLEIGSYLFSFVGISSAKYIYENK